MPRLTERRQRQTRNELVDVALALFAEHGFDEITMSQIADAAGVSRRTVYRYFSSKDDLIFEFPRRWLTIFQDEVSSRKPDEALQSLIRRTFVSIAEEIDLDSERVLAAFTVLQNTETLRGMHGRSDDFWVSMLTEMMMAEPGCTPDMLLQVMIAARCMIATNNSAIAYWALSQGESDIVSDVNRAYDLLDPLWPEIFVG